MFVFHTAIIHKQNMDQCNKNRRSIYLRDLKDDVGSLQQSEVIEAFLVHSVHIYCMMHHIFYVMSYP